MRVAQSLKTAHRLVWVKLWLVASTGFFVLAIVLLLVAMVMSWFDVRIPWVGKLDRVTMWSVLGGLQVTSLANLYLVQRWVSKKRTHDWIRGQMRVP
jgi:membrane protein implicated in regulation of membrane protease activity